MIKGTAGALLLVTSTLATAQSTELENDLLKLMSLEVETTSAMKRSQPVNSTPASIFVLGRRDIELSGYTTLPELLKLIPGIDARRIDANQWAVSVRSAASRFNTNIMVMVDGRNIGAANINGIYWETLNYPVEDIERIELVRGAGGSLWGNSANNGILNIITKHSLDTQGAYVKLSLGDQVKQSQNVRFGGTINDQMSYRLFGFHRQGRRSHDKVIDGELVVANDHAHSYSFGGQYDYQYREKSAFKAQYQFSKIRNGVLNRGVDPINYGLTHVKDTGTFKVHTYNLRLDHHESQRLRLFAQLSYNDVSLVSDFSTDTYQSLVLNTATNYQWDSGLFSAGVDIENNQQRLSYLGSSLMLDANIYGLFVQNESYFFADKLKILLGVRWDKIKVYGSEASPNIRFNVNINQQQSLWGAYSKGNRIVATSDEAVDLKFVLPNTLSPIPSILIANTKDTIERASTLELGYRYAAGDFNLNVSLFDREYDSLFIGQPNTILIDQRPVLLTQISNKGTGSSRGGDLVATWQADNQLELMLGYSYISYHLDANERQIAFSPNNFTNAQWYARGHYAINENVSSQLLFKYIGDNASFGSPSYSIVDIAVHWQVNSRLKLSLSGLNLTNSAFVEFQNDAELFSASTAIGRSINVFLQYQF